MKPILLFAAMTLSAMVLRAQIPANIVQQGLVAYHDFDSTFVDQSGNNASFTNNGVVFEELLHVGRKIVTARFDGTPTKATYLEALNSDLFKTSQYSYMVRFKVNEFRPVNSGGINFYYQSIIAFCPPSWIWGPAYSLMLNQMDNSAINAGHWTEASAYVAGSLSNAILLDKWHTAVATYDGAVIRLYLDGQQVGEQQAELDFDNQVAFIIGGAKDGTDGVVMGGFSGNIDEFGFWDRALTQEEITRVFKADTTDPCSKYRAVDSVTLDSRQETTWSSLPLKKGVQYQIKGRGIWTPNGGFSKADCEYEYFDPCTIRNRAGGVRFGLDGMSALSDDQKLKPIETTIDCATHTYTYQVVGDGRPIYVLFRDNVYTDNDGLIDVVVSECDDCSSDLSSDSVLGYRSVETHQVVTYALRSNPSMSYQWIATGGYLLGPSTNHFCDVIWGYDNVGSVCCIVSDSICQDTICVTTSIQPKSVVGVRSATEDRPSMVVRPNPANDELVIESTSASAGSSFELIDATGSAVYQASGAQTRLDVTIVPMGVYHVVHRDSDGAMLGMQRVIIVR